jgi:hypothetical protein
MSTLQNTPQHRNGTRTRLGARALALGTLIAIGLASLILMPGHHTSAPTGGSTAQQAALAAQSPAPAGCFRDPATHALTCSQAASVPIATHAPPGYFRDPATHKLLRIPVARKRPEHLPPSHSRGRIVP